MSRNTGIFTWRKRRKASEDRVGDMRRFFLSVIGGVGIILAIYNIIPLLNRGSIEHTIFRLMLYYPFFFFNMIFPPNGPGDFLPFWPSIWAILCVGIFDVILYSSVAYVMIRLLEKWWIRLSVGDIE